MHDTMSTPFNPEYRGRARRMVMLVRREFWEHRALWALPAILVALSVLLTLFSLAAPGRINAHLQDEGPRIGIDGQNRSLTQLIPGLAHSGLHVELGEVTVGNLLRFFADLPFEVREQALRLMLLATAKSLLLPLGFLVLALTINVLRRETRSRSIYFFKSMPLGELEMIGAKVLVLAPLCWLIMVLTVAASHLGSMLVMSVAALFAGLNPWTVLWAPAPLLSAWGSVAGELALDFLWFLPMLGFFFAVNAWNDARRLAAAMAVLVAAVADELFFSGGGLFHWLGRHVPPPGWALRGPRGDAFQEFSRMGQLETLDWASLLSGIAVGLALLWLSTWLLRWKEER